MKNTGTSPEALIHLSHRNQSLGQKILKNMMVDNVILEAELLFDL
jgi:hypothetical protein